MFICFITLRIVFVYTNHDCVDSVNNCRREVFHIFRWFDYNWCVQASRPIAQIFRANRRAALNRNNWDVHVEFHHAVAIERNVSRWEREIAIGRLLLHIYEKGL